MLSLIPLFPFAGFLVNAFIGRRLPKNVSGGLACLAMLASFAVSVMQVWTLVGMEPAAREINNNLYTWFSSGDFLIDLASPDEAIWERSIRETQKVIDITRSLERWFTLDQPPVVIVTMGGFTKDAHVPREQRRALYGRIARALERIDASGVRLTAQTLPPFPWLMGGQQYHNLFLEPEDTVAFCREAGLRLTLDISHSKLAANFYHRPFSEYVEAFAPLLAAAFARLLGAWRMSEPAALARSWEERAHPRGTPLSVHQGPDEMVDGLFDGIDGDGALRLRLSDGRVAVIRAGDVALEQDVRDRVGSFLQLLATGRDTGEYHRFGRAHQAGQVRRP